MIGGGKIATREKKYESRRDPSALKLLYTFYTGKRRGSRDTRSVGIKTVPLDRNRNNNLSVRGRALRPTIAAVHTSVNVETGLKNSDSWGN